MLSMWRWLAVICMVTGFTFITYAGWNIWQTNQAQSAALQEAEALINNDVEHNVSRTETGTADDVNIQDIHQGETIGLLDIPRLDRRLPIIAGTSEDELERGVGHFEGTALPGEKDQIVLSGHRDTVFTRLGELEKGDEFIVTMPYGAFTYVIYDFKIVDADDRTIIAPTKPNEVLTVTTCYPFGYVGNAPQRYIIYAKPNTSSQ